MKVAFLLSELSGYMAACQKELIRQTQQEILVYHWPKASNAPFDDSLIDHIAFRYEKNTQTIIQDIVHNVEDFGANVVIMSGWMDKEYLKAAKILKKSGVKIIAGSDTQSNGNWRQRVASKISPWYLKPSIDILWVTGDRQKKLANRLGYWGNNVMTGFYTCDWDKFQNTTDKSGNRVFLYVGRLIERKGILDLLEAYKLYREKVSDPWKLYIAGTGELEQSCLNVPGVKLSGFVQPAELPSVYQGAGAFVLPSHYEPWGVALHEAAASSLPLIASSAVGAGDHLIENGVNGYVQRANNKKNLLQCLLNMHHLSKKDQIEMGKNSFLKSQEYTPNVWIKSILNQASKIDN